MASLKPFSLLLLLAVPVFFLALGANSIWDANEAFYVETPRQMLESGDYVNPSFNAQPRLNKPVLSYWVVAGFYHAFGVSVTVERVAIALGAVGILLGAILIGRAVGSTTTGVLAALLLATAPRFVFFSRRIFIDMYVTLFMTLALACFVMAERQPERRRLYLLLMYVALGLGVLTKGPIALAIPVLVAMAWLITERRLKDLTRLMLPIGAVSVLAIVVPWYAALYAQHGWEPIRSFFLDENVGRYANPLTTERGPAFFVLALFGDVLMPWAPLLIIPIATVWRRAAATDSSGAIRRILWWWVAITAGIFSLSASKEDLYILPAIPAAAVLVADLLVSTGFGVTHRGVRGVIGGIAVVSLAMAALIAMFFTDGHYRLAGAVGLALVLAGTGVAAGVALWRRRAGMAVATIATGFIAFNYTFVLWVLPDVERLKPVPPLALAFAKRASPDAKLGFFNMDLPSFVFYTQRPIAKLGDIDQAVEFFNSNREVWVLAGEGQWAELSPRMPTACVAARAPMLAAKGSDVLARRPPPDVLLLTNKCQ